MNECTKQHDCYEEMCYPVVVHTPPTAEVVARMQDAERLVISPQAREKMNPQLIDLARDITGELPPDQIVSTR